MAAHPSNLVNKWTFPRLFKAAWSSAITSSNVKNGFWACGIYPLNKDAITKEAYDPSLPFEIPATEAQEASQDIAQAEVSIESTVQTNGVGNAQVENVQPVEITMNSVDIHQLQEQLHVPESIVSPGPGPSLSVDAPPIGQGHKVKNYGTM